MQRRFFSVVPALLAAAMVCSLSSPAVAREDGPVVVISLDGEVSEAQFFFLRRALKEAERNEASAVVLDLDTFGGAVPSAIKEMEALMKMHVPTYTYVNPKALSAGSLIALATKYIYMAPGAVIGAAAPIQSDGQDLSATMKEKAVSSISAIARAASQKYGHNADIAVAFIRKEATLKIGDVTLDSPETLLTLSAEEAVKQYDGKPLLAVGIAQDLPAMLKAAGLHGEVVRVEPSGFERLAFYITALAPLLLLGGIIGAYIEFKVPGFGLPGTLSFICFGLFFAGHYIAGLAGNEVIIVFAIGIALVLSEVFLHPGTVLPGVFGVVLMAGSLVWAMVDRYPGDGFWPSNYMLGIATAKLAFTLVLAGAAIYLLSKYLPRTSFYHSIVLGAKSPAGPLISSLGKAAVLPGMTGVAHTVLRPSGKAEFGDSIVDVVSQGEFIARGAEVRVVAVEGPRVVVELSAPPADAVNPSVGTVD